MPANSPSSFFIPSSEKTDIASLTLQEPTDGSAATSTRTQSSAADEHARQILNGLFESIIRKDAKYSSILSRIREEYHLAETNPEVYGMRHTIFVELFESIIVKDEKYGPLLRKIKNEYDKIVEFRPALQKWSCPVEVS